MLKWLTIIDSVVETEEIQAKKSRLNANIKNQ